MEEKTEQTQHLGVPFTIANEIMGPKAYWGLEQVFGYLGLRLPSAVEDTLELVPYTEAILHGARHSHILAVKVGLSPHDLYKYSGLEGLIEGHWSRTRLAKIKTVIGWSLVRTGVVLNSLDETMETQVNLLGVDEKVPSVGTLINAIVAYRLLNGTSLFLDTCARCIDGTPDLYRVGHRIHVSRTRDGQLYADHFSEDAREPRLGIASRKKTTKELILEGLPVR